VPSSPRQPATQKSQSTCAQKGKASAVSDASPRNGGRDDIGAKQPTTPYVETLHCCWALFHSVPVLFGVRFGMTGVAKSVAP
jgi:hypothetical protein